MGGREGEGEKAEGVREGEAIDITTDKLLPILPLISMCAQLVLPYYYHTCPRQLPDCRPSLEATECQEPMETGIYIFQ